MTLPRIATRTRPITRATLRACRLHRTPRNGTTRKKATIGECHSPTMIQQRIRAGGRGRAVQAQPVPASEGFQLHASVFGCHLFHKKKRVVVVFLRDFHPQMRSRQVRHSVPRRACLLLSPRVSCSPAQLDTLAGRALCAQDLAGTLQCSPRLHSDISALSWRTAAGDKQCTMRQPERWADWQQVCGFS